MGPTRQPHPRARVADGRAPRGSHSARPRGATPARSAGGGAPTPDGRRRRPPARRSGGRERGGKSERRRRSTVHPGATVATEEAAGAEGGGGAARVDGDGGAPAVGQLDEGVNGDGDGAAKPKEATPGRETVWGDDGGGPELGGDSGERESDVASSNPARRKGGERRKRTEEVRGGFK
uniref:OSJNBa0017P10.1 protein n=1 Tax=Oryza sativa subsp. japonica TaxID=39947 RepID=Q7XQ54_ORYSJ|nr:OSJNBb0046P18.6 [Oryza sativa Japonica Group]CAE04924.1 OSJNBa0017P10.1 [Oryza sativa Japonica Group]